MRLQTRRGGPCRSICVAPWPFGSTRARSLRTNTEAALKRFRQWRSVQLVRVFDAEALTSNPGRGVKSGPAMDGWWSWYRARL